MRVDKYLWCIRVYKTRSLAASQCKLEKVWVNEGNCKASRELKPGDVVKVRKGPIHFSFEVKAMPKARLGAKLVPDYARDVTSAEEKHKMEIIRLQFKTERQPGLGRPTKKERRELDDYTTFDFTDFEEEELGDQ
jgi:ribosome-associated heat shock protein Hsp15